MTNCKLSKDNGYRTECVALTWSEYLKMVRAGKCGNEGCPFYKPRKGATKSLINLIGFDGRRS